MIDDITRTRHLLERTGFTETPQRVFAEARRPAAALLTERLTSAAPIAPIDPPAWVHEPTLRFALFEDLPEERRRAARGRLRDVQREQLKELQGWWLANLIVTEAPLAARMTLFWQNHLTSGHRKVRHAALLLDRNPVIGRLGQVSGVGEWEAPLPPRLDAPCDARMKPLLADDLMADVGSAPMDDLRRLRVDLTRSEGDVSFVRRITQGRLDIVGHEVGRRGRADGAVETDLGASPIGDPSELLFDMPDILADPTTSGGARSAGAARHNPLAEPGPVAISLLASLDGIASPHELSTVAELTAEVLALRFEALREFEIELSSIRRRLHDRIDTIQDEIARRYRDGEASVDALLR